MEISERIERGEAEIERKNGKGYSQKCSEERDLYQECRMETGGIEEPCYFTYLEIDS